VSEFRALAKTFMTVARGDRWQGIAALVVFQLALTVAAFTWELPWSDPEPLVGLGESQMALAVLLLVCGTQRISQRMPLALLLLFSGWVLHYISWVRFIYPMIAGEEYFSSLGTALCMAMCLYAARLSRLFRRADAGHELPSIAATKYHWTLTIGDLLVCTFAVGAVLVIGQRAFALTDLSGIMDPWDSVDFAITFDPGWLASKLPRLGLAIVWQGVMWTVISRWLLTRERWRWWFPIQIAGLFIAITLGEILIGQLRWFSDHPWLFCPPGMFPVRFLTITWDLFFGEGRREYDPNNWLLKVGIVLVSRAVVFVTSLLLLRRAGFRFDARLRLTRAWEPAAISTHARNPTIGSA
jgi:hypothetical protein